jgi:hypothetical protein
MKKISKYEMLMTNDLKLRNKELNKRQKKLRTNERNRTV